MRIKPLIILWVLLISMPVISACEDDPPPPMTPLQRLRRSRTAVPKPPPPPPPPVHKPSKSEKAAKNKTNGESILRGPCPLAGEDRARCPVRLAKPATSAVVAHVLLGWRGSLPTNGPDREEDASRVLAIDIAHKARGEGQAFMPLVWQHSDDEGRGVYRLDKRTRHRYVKPFVKAAMRLGVGQVDAIRSPFGYHVIRRMPATFQPPPRPARSIVSGPCPLADEDGARCPQEDATTAANSVVEHILIGYKGSLSRRQVARAYKRARQLAVEVAHKARRQGADFAALRARFSDDPGSGRYEVSADSMHDKRFAQLALRLAPGQIDAVETGFGFHVVMRVR